MTVSTVLFDSAGRRRSPATMPGYHAGRPPRNRGMSYPADPPAVQEIIAVMRQAGDGRHGARLRGLIVVLWRGGLRIQEALSLSERDLDPQRGSLLVRHGNGGRRGRRRGMTAQSTRGNHGAARSTRDPSFWAKQASGLWVDLPGVIATTTKVELQVSVLRA